MSINLFRPSIKRRDMDAVLTCLVEDKLTTGDPADELAKAVCDNCGAYKGIALRDMYRAVELVYAAVNAAEIGTIIATPLISEKYVHIAEKLNIAIKYVDVHPETGVIESDSVAELEGIDVAAIIVNYPLGMFPDIHSIKALGVPVIEDITQAFLAKNGEEVPGSEGDYVVIGTEAQDILTTGGGALLLAGDKPQWSSLKKQIGDFGDGLLMSDMNASLGLSQLKELPGFIEKIQEIHEIYQRAVSRGAHSSLPVSEDMYSVMPVYTVKLEKGLNEAKAYAKKKKIETELAYKNTAIELIEDPAEYTKAYSLYLRSLAFPLYSSLGRKDVEVISKILTTLP